MTKILEYYQSLKAILINLEIIFIENHSKFFATII